MLSYVYSRKPYTRRLLGVQKHDLGTVRRLLFWKPFILAVLFVCRQAMKTSAQYATASICVTIQTRDIRCNRKEHETQHEPLYCAVVEPWFKKLLNKRTGAGKTLTVISTFLTRTQKDKIRVSVEPSQDVTRYLFCLPSELAIVSVMVSPAVRVTRQSEKERRRPACKAFQAARWWNRGFRLNLLRNVVKNHRG